MRLDIAPIVLEARALLRAIQAGSWSQSANSADRLLKLLPSPAWAETAPGMVIWSPEEKEATQRINAMRCQVMNWMSRFCDETISQENDDDWPVPANLDLSITNLAGMMVSASVRAD